MRIPKKFELHLATGDVSSGMRYDVVRVSDDGRSLEATDGVVVARVPIDGPGGVTREGGEPLPAGALLDASAWAEAVKGTKGEGTLRLQDDAQVASAGGPPRHYPPPLTDPELEQPPVAEAFRQADAEYKGLQVVRLTLDAEALHRLARAMGSTEVRLEVPVRSDVPGLGNGDLHAEVRLVPTFGLRVTPADNSGPRGLIMPTSREGGGS